MVSAGSSQGEAPSQTPTSTPAGTPIPRALAPRRRSGSRPVPYLPPPLLTVLPSAGALFLALQRRWLIALMAGLSAAALIVLLLMRFLPHTYRATAWLQFDRPSATVAETPDAAQGKAAPGLALVKTPLLLERVLEEAEVASSPGVRRQARPRDWLEQVLEIETTSPTMVQLSAIGEEPATPALLVNRIISVYLNELRQERQARLSQLRDHYRRCEALAAGELPPPASAPSQAPTPAPDDSKRLNAERALEMARADLRKAQMDLVAAKQLAAETTNFDSQIKEELDRDEQVKQLRQEIDRIEQTMERVKKVATKGDKAPQYLRLQEQRDDLLEKIKERKADITSKLEKQAQGKSQDNFQAKLTQLEAQVATLKELELRLIKELQSLVQPPKPPPAKGQPEPRSPVVQTQPSQPGQQEALRRLGGEIRLLETEGPDAIGARPWGVVETQLVDERKRWLTISLSGASVGLLLVLAVGCLEFQTRRLRHADDIAVGLQMPLLGTLPSGSGANLADLAKPGPLADAADVLRTLLLQKIGEGPALIIVGSAGAKQGSTTLAVQLAASLARSWRRTLLLDGQLRQPGLPLPAGAAAAPGLCDVLRGEVDPVEAALVGGLSRLWIMPAGHCDAHALQALAQPEAHQLFQTLREQYECVVVDAGTLLASADALSISGAADAVLVAVRPNVSRAPEVHAVHLRLKSMAVPLVAAVLCGGSGKMDQLVRV